MPDNPPSPASHDHLVRYLMDDPHYARGVLEPAFPKALAQRIDWTTLQLQPGSFINSELRARHTDALFTASVAGRKAWLYILHESKSTPEPQLLPMLLVYTGRIVERFLRENPNAKKVPAILPTVLYNGSKPWTLSNAYADHVDLPADVYSELNEYLLDFRHVLESLEDVPEAELWTRAAPAYVRACLVLLKTPQAGETVLDVLARGEDTLKEALIGERSSAADAEAILMYILWVWHEAPDAVQKWFYERLGPKAGEFAMNAAEELMERGAKKGRLEGLSEGRLEGHRESFTHLLRLRFKTVEPETITRINAASEEELTEWTEKVFNANSPEEVFGSKSQSG